MRFRRSGRGILKGAAFRQRPLSRLLLNVLAGTRTLPPEEPEPKVSWRLASDGKAYVFDHADYPNQATTFCAHCQFVPDMSRGIDGRAKMDYTDCEKRNVSNLENPIGIPPNLRIKGEKSYESLCWRSAVRDQPALQVRHRLL